MVTGFRVEPTPEDGLFASLARRGHGQANGKDQVEIDEAVRRRRLGMLSALGHWGDDAGQARDPLVPAPLAAMAPRWQELVADPADTFFRNFPTAFLAPPARDCGTTGPRNPA